jgi:hypothetical protein
MNNHLTINGHAGVTDTSEKGIIKGKASMVKAAKEGK